MTASFLNPGWPMTLIDAAARSILMAFAVGVGLHTFRVTNVRARKVAWVLVLTGAITMPMLAPWVESQAWLSARAAVVPLQAWVEQAKAWGTTTKRHDAPTPHRAVVTPYQSTRAADSETITLQPPDRKAVVNSDRYPSPSITMDNPGRNSVQIRASTPPRMDISARQLLFVTYFLIAGALLLRLAFGLTTALRLWLRAEPVKLGADSSFGADLPVRWCRDISSPVTVGSGILLPATHKFWDDEKLRIVLAHESSHVRQGDFYLQLCAGIYAAVFWFSPLGWWLKRTLCDLSEAVSDGAAVSQAATHASYAQVLLEFAAMPRTTRIGVAMARSGRLSHRIERLLDESNFRRAFAGGRGRMLIASMLAPMALFAATSLIRVEAAGQAPPTPAIPAAPASPAVLAVPPAPAIPGSPASPAEPAALPAPAAPDDATFGAIAPAAPSAPAIAGAPEAPPAPAAPDGNVAILVQSSGTGESYAMTTSQSDSHSRSRGRSSTHMSTGNGYSFWYADNGDAYALISGNDKEHVQFSGDWADGRREDLDKARRMAHGDFLWFTHDSKSYVVDDPSIVAELVAMYKPMDELGRQQEELGRKQEALGQEQEKMGERMTQATVPTPDITKEMAALNAAVAELNAAKGKTVTQDQLSELQEKLSEVQGRLGDLQGEMGAREGEIGALQGKLGEQQGELGEKQGRLGEQQGRIAHDADRKVKSVIDQSLKNGKARPVE